MGLRAIDDYEGPWAWMRRAQTYDNWIGGEPADGFRSDDAVFDGVPLRGKQRAARRRLERCRVSFENAREEDLKGYVCQRPGMVDLVCQPIERRRRCGHRHLHVQSGPRGGLSVKQTPPPKLETVPASALSEGGVWTCTVLPFDGEDDGAEGTAQLDFTSPSTWTSEWLDVDAEAEVDAVCAVGSNERVQCWADGSSGGLTVVPETQFLEVSIYENMVAAGEQQGACGVRPRVGSSAGRHRQEKGLRRCHRPQKACFTALTAASLIAVRSTRKAASSAGEQPPATADKARPPTSPRVPATSRSRPASTTPARSQQTDAWSAGVEATSARTTSPRTLATWGWPLGSTVAVPSPEGRPPAGAFDDEPEVDGLTQLFGHRSMMCSLSPEDEHAGSPDEDASDRVKATTEPLWVLEPESGCTRPAG